MPIEMMMEPLLNFKNFLFRSNRIQMIVQHSAMICQ